MKKVQNIINLPNGPLCKQKTAAGDMENYNW